MSKNPIQLLPSTPIASVVWMDGSNPVLRVFFQAVDSEIRHADWKVGGWSGGDEKTNIGKARFDSPLAAISYQDGGQEQVRVYYLNNDSVIQELCWASRDNRWISGDLNKSNIKALPASQLTAVRDPQGYIRVFFQGFDTVIHEVVHSNTWGMGRSFAKTLVGCGLAAIAWGNSLRVYAQSPDTKLVEFAIDSNNNFYNGAFSGRGAPASASLAAITWSNTPQIRVYTISQNGDLQEYAYQGASGWTGPLDLPQSVPGSRVSAVTWGSITDIRVYRQANDNQILEEVWHSGWSTGSLIPTGPVQ